MTNLKLDRQEFLRLTEQGLSDLISKLTEDGYQVVGPTVTDGVIDFGYIEGLADLPWGQSDKQEPGQYRLKDQGDRWAFGHANGPGSLKTYFHPPERLEWTASQDEQGITFQKNDTPIPRYAFIGLRACDIASLRVLDGVLQDGLSVDSYYSGCREQSILIAVNCTHPSKSCFCTSFGYGPHAEEGFDLVLTENHHKDGNTYLVEIGSERGKDIVKKVAFEPAQQSDIVAKEVLKKKAAKKIKRTLNTNGLKDRLQENPDDPRWQKIAERCLTCGNCTMVCPTCFCSTYEDHTDLKGENTERWAKWDSCFSLDFSFVAGGPARQSGASRYRQWMTHKLSTWVDQFDTYGCIGCGRCITWCPVGIDITEEVDLIGILKDDRGSAP